MCMCFGVATMFLGTAMVPVAAPVWGDVLEAKICVHSGCVKNCFTNITAPSGARECGQYKPDQTWQPGECKKTTTNCADCSGVCTDTPVPNNPTLTECRCKLTGP